MPAVCCGEQTAATESLVGSSSPWGMTGTSNGIRSENALINCCRCSVRTNYINNMVNTTHTGS